MLLSLALGSCCSAMWIGDLPRRFRPEVGPRMVTSPEKVSTNTKLFLMFFCGGQYCTRWAEFSVSWEFEEEAAEILLCQHFAVRLSRVHLCFSVYVSVLLHVAHYCRHEAC